MVATIKLSWASFPALEISTRPAVHAILLQHPGEKVLTAIA